MPVDSDETGAVVGIVLNVPSQDVQAIFLRC